MSKSPATRPAAPQRRLALLGFLLVGLAESVSWSIATRFWNAFSARYSDLHRVLERQPAQLLDLLHDRDELRVPLGRGRCGDGRGRGHRCCQTERREHHEHCDRDPADDTSRRRRTDPAASHQLLPSPAESIVIGIDGRSLEPARLDAPLFLLNVRVTTPPVHFAVADSMDEEQLTHPAPVEKQSRAENVITESAPRRVGEPSVRSCGCATTE